MDDKTSDDTKPDKPAPKAKPKAKAAGRPVSEWAKIKFPKVQLRHSDQNHADYWKHEAASALHHWPEHAYHGGSEMSLAEGDYDAAIEAACKIDKRGSYTPHPAALSEHAGLGIKNEKPGDV